MLKFLMLVVINPVFAMLVMSLEPYLLTMSVFTDSLSFPLIILTMWICYMAMKMGGFVSTLMKLIMLFSIISFSCTSLITFYMCFEATLIPMFAMILGWGTQPERLQAGIYLLFYTIFFSVPLLISIMTLKGKDFLLMDVSISCSMAFLLAFLVKLPMFTLHFWLPKAHVEAPLAGSMILAGILLKLGGYGLMRVIPFTTTNLNIIMMISSIAVVTVSLMCLRQTDLKKLIALSSVSHMAYVLMAILTKTTWGVAGATMMMVAHGLSSSGMFYLTNVTYLNTSSRSLLLNKSICTLYPSMAIVWFMMTCGNMGSPPSVNFLSEVVISGSLIGWNLFMIVPVVLGMFLSVCYSIYVYSATNHGTSLYKVNKTVKVSHLLMSVLHIIPMFFITIVWNY